MRRKLKEQEGAALVMVLCMGALFISLSAAMVYAAGQLTASANRLYWEQDAYQQARSFSTCIEQELCGAQNTQLRQFVNEVFLRGMAYSENREYTFTQPVPDTGGDFAELSVTISKEILLATREDPGVISFPSEAAALEWARGYVGRVNDSAVTVRVTAQGGTAACTFTQTYLRTGEFPLVFVIDSNEYLADSNGVLYQRGVTNGEPYRWEDLRNRELRYYFDTAEGKNLEIQKEGGAADHAQEPLEG